MNVAILTDFRTPNDTYSLTHVVDSQVKMLERYGHDVTVMSCEGFSGPDWPIDPCFPPITPQEYSTADDLSDEHHIFADQVASILIEKLKGFDVAFSHDWIFSPWKLPFAEALKPCHGKLRLPFFHWLHSRPCYDVDWWDLNRYGANHDIVWVNRVDQALVADVFKTEIPRVHYIPNVKDIRILHNFTDEAMGVIDEFPCIMDATFVQVYPAPVERLTDKGVVHLIHLYGEIKRRGFTVGLMIVNGTRSEYPPENLQRYERMAIRCGLDPDVDFAFSSRLGFDTSMPRRTLLDLMTCSSLFVFPSQAEADPLIVPEAVLMSGAMPVFNRSLPVMQEIAFGTGLALDFSSADNRKQITDYGWMADRIIGAYFASHHCRTQYRQKFNMDRIYRQFYAPLLAEVACS